MDAYFAWNINFYKYYFRETSYYSTLCIVILVCLTQCCKLGSSNCFFVLIIYSYTINHKHLSGHTLEYKTVIITVAVINIYGTGIGEVTVVFRD